MDQRMEFLKYIIRERAESIRMENAIGNEFVDSNYYETLTSDATIFEETTISDSVLS